jgi:hypothetical protein
MTILHKNEKEINIDVLEAINDGWTVLGNRTMFGPEKSYLNISYDGYESFINKHGDDFDFIDTNKGYKILFTELTRVVPDANDLTQDLFNPHN